MKTPGVWVSLSKGLKNNINIKAMSEDTKVILTSNQEHDSVEMPVGEDGIEFQVGEEGDRLAITHDEKPIFDVSLASWSEEGEPCSVEESKHKVKLVLAKDKKFYQRGIAQFIINDQEPVNLHVDALMSCFYAVYGITNPYKGYDPMIDRVNAFALIKLHEATETEPEKMEVLEICVRRENIELIKRSYESQVHGENLSIKEVVLAVETPEVEEKPEELKKELEEGV
jgi:hypothetical protein